MQPHDTAAPDGANDASQPVDLTTAAGLAAVPVGDYIHWRRLGAGKALGYRRTKADMPGQWWARRRNPETKRQEYGRLGDLATTLPGKRPGRAYDLAIEWFAQCEQGLVEHAARTVRDAIDRHETRLRRVKGQARKAAEFRAQMQRHVLSHAIASIPLQRLTVTDCEDWRADLRARANGRTGESLAPGTVNRVTTRFRAALNAARDAGHVASDRAWRVAFRPEPNADRSRGLDLDHAQRAAWIAACAPDVGALLRGLSMVPLRPGVLAAFTVERWNRRTRSLHVMNDKNGKPRWVRLPPVSAQFFDEQCRNKLPGAPIFTRADGSPWQRSNWTVPAKAGALAAGLPPETCAYNLRHAVISDLVSAGLDLNAVAKVSGTSVAMIERHYGHLRGDDVTDALARIAVAA